MSRFGELRLISCSMTLFNKVSDANTNMSSSSSSSEPSHMFFPLDNLLDMRDNAESELLISPVKKSQATGSLGDVTSSGISVGRPPFLFISFCCWLFPWPS
jgi:hypothetical protein